MTGNADKIARGTRTGLAAIRAAVGTKAGADSVDLFAEHHIEETEPAYWQRHLGTSKPAREQVIGLLTLRGHWGSKDDDIDEDGLDIFDFTLPDGITDYVLSVEFGEDGHVRAVAMES